MVLISGMRKVIANLFFFLLTMIRSSTTFHWPSTYYCNPLCSTRLKDTSHVHLNTHTHTSSLHTGACTHLLHIHTYKKLFACAYMHTFCFTRTRTHMHTRSSWHAHTCTHVSLHTHTHASSLHTRCMHTPHTHTHTCTHAHTHTHSQLHVHNLCRLNVLFLKRFWRVMRVAFPRLCSKSFLLFLILVFSRSAGSSRFLTGLFLVHRGETRLVNRSFVLCTGSWCKSFSLWCRQTLHNAY